MSARTYPWLSATGQRWKYCFDLFIGVYGFFATLLAVGFGFAALMWPKMGYVSLALIAIYLLGGLIEMYLMYWTIKCPKCGHNPTRRKDGKWASPRYLEGKFRKLTECPKCGKGTVPNLSGAVNDLPAPSDRH
jgi:endogenous inhibitor of DNA gyrase (YacG/DUF329 family)